MRFAQKAVWVTIVATAFLPGCSKPPPPSSPPLTAVQRAAAEKMLQRAQQVYRAVSILEARNPGRPDLIEMEITWSRNTLAAQLSNCTKGPERRKALEDHLEEAKARVDRIRQIPPGATTDLVTAQVEYALAEAEYLQVTEK